MKISQGLWRPRSLLWLIRLLLLFYISFPFCWAITSSFKTDQELLRQPATFIPQNPTWRNYQFVLYYTDFLKAIGNSIIVATATVALSLLLGSFAAYALGKLRFRGKQVWLYLILAMTMFPQISILSALYAIIRTLKLSPMPGMIISYLIFTLPLTIWLLTTYFKALPDELMQAAEVDGATPLQAFYLILLPLTMPALITTGLLTFISAWNEYLFALTFTSIEPNAHTLPIAIASIPDTLFGPLMAANVMIMIPITLLMLIFQERIVEGLTGAING
ncbi:MAG: carbohydrate ABC transporter permease [Ardenticatenaceae bacterium]